VGSYAASCTSGANISQLRVWGVDVCVRACDAPPAAAALPPAVPQPRALGRGEYGTQKCSEYPDGGFLDLVLCENRLCSRLLAENVERPPVRTGQYVWHRTPPPPHAAAPPRAGCQLSS
jgi:hypothetical protein